MSIGELADAAGISRRAVRFYVERDLLPAPSGLGRGRHYDQTHLDRLKMIQELQEAGHSLDAIARILRGQSVEAPEVNALRARPRAKLSAELWSRVKILEGVELHFDVTRRNLTVEQLLAVRQAVHAIVGRDASDE